MPYELSTARRGGQWTRHPSLDCLLDIRTHGVCQAAPPAASAASPEGRSVVDAILAYDDDALAAALALDPAAAGRPDGDTVTPLMYCVAQGWAEGMAALLACGARDPQAHDVCTEGRGGMFFQCPFGEVPCVDYDGCLHALAEAHAVMGTTAAGHAGNE